LDDQPLQVKYPRQYSFSLCKDKSMVEVGTWKRVMRIAWHVVVGTYHGVEKGLCVEKRLRNNLLIVSQISSERRGTQDSW